MKAVAYISGPLTATSRAAVKANIKAARIVAQELLNMGLAVFCPHANYQGMVGSYDDFMDACLAHLQASSLLVMLPDWRTSPGACVEHGFARAIELPTFEWPGDERDIAGWMEAFIDA